MLARSRDLLWMGQSFQRQRTQDASGYCLFAGCLSHGKLNFSLFLASKICKVLTMLGLCLVCKTAISLSTLEEGLPLWKGSTPFGPSPTQSAWCWVIKDSVWLLKDQWFFCMSNGLSRCGRELHQFPGHTPQNQIKKTQLGWDLALCTSVNPNRCVVCIQLSHPNTPYTRRWMQIPVGDMKNNEHTVILHWPPDPAAFSDLFINILTPYMQDRAQHSTGQFWHTRLGAVVVTSIIAMFIEGVEGGSQEMKGRTQA